MTLQNLHAVTDLFGATPKMPVLFVGHGNPMNAVEDTGFARGWQTVGQSIPKPNAILCVSAHWETKGTFVTAMEKPRTIHDFGGFPKELFQVQYPAPGSPALANATKHIVTSTDVGLDQSWGLDHGCWSVVRHLYPAADVPVIQMSLDYQQTPRAHYELARELGSLRTRGVLILGSGNIVHNLGAVDWHNDAGGYDWAIEANDTVKKLITDHNHDSIINYETLGRPLRLAVPTAEHFLPLLYAIGLQDDNDAVTFFNDKTVMGSLSMTSVTIG
jgi:4,5-DOPA dioxygenase extradiol